MNLISILALAIITVMVSCAKTNAPNSIGTASGCMFDKISNFENRSGPGAMLEGDFYFYYTGNKLTQLNTTSFTGALNGSFFYAEDKLTRIDLYTPVGGSMIKTGYLNVSYNGINIAETDFYAIRGGNSTLMEKIVYTYDNNGRRVAKNTTGQFTSEAGNCVYTYDNLNNITKIECRDTANKITDIYELEYNNHVNDLLSYHPQLDIFGWVFLNENEELEDNRRPEDARYFSKYQVVSQKDIYTASNINYQYEYDSTGKTVQITSNGDIIKINFQYKCN